MSWQSNWKPKCSNSRRNCKRRLTEWKSWSLLKLSSGKLQKRADFCKGKWISSTFNVGKVRYYCERRSSLWSSFILRRSWFLVRSKVRPRPLLVIQSRSRTSWIRSENPLQAVWIKWWRKWTKPRKVSPNGKEPWYNSNKPSKNCKGNWEAKSRSSSRNCSQ